MWSYPHSSARFSCKPSSGDSRGCRRAHRATPSRCPCDRRCVLRSKCQNHRRTGSRARCDTSRRGERAAADRRVSAGGDKEGGGGNGIGHKGTGAVHGREAVETQVSPTAGGCIGRSRCRARVRDERWSSIARPVHRERMISHITGILTSKDIDRVDVMTAGGVGYELQIPLGVFETLPKQGEKILLHTYLVVKDDCWQLFGFSSVFERRLFQKLLTANGVGPALALGLMSALSARRLVRAIQEKDIATLQGVPRVGRKKAERLILDLADKLDGIGGEEPGAPRAASGSAEDAMRALVSLGYTNADAEKGVRGALDSGGGGLSAAELIRAALAKLGGR